MLPVLKYSDPGSKLSPSPFEVRSPINSASQDNDGFDSASSGGSMKIRRLGTLDLPIIDSVSQSDCSSYGETSSQLARPSPSARAWHKWPLALRLNAEITEAMEIDTPRTPEGPQTVNLAGASGFEIDKNRDIDAEDIREFKIPKIASKSPEIVPRGLSCDASETSLITARWEPAAETALPAAVQPDLQDTIYNIESWDTAVHVTTECGVEHDGRLSVRHTVQMTLVVPNLCLFAEWVKFAVMVSNGISGKHEKLMEGGRSSLSFDDDMPVSSFAQHEDGEIIVVRDARDVEQPITLYFWSKYPPQVRRVTVPLPTVRPHAGKILSESVSIVESSPLVIAKPLSQRPISTWKSTSDASSHIKCFERNNIPPLYPERFKDDIHIEIINLKPVHFLSLDNLQSCDIVWNFNVNIERVLTGGLECDMSFTLEIGKPDRIVSLDPSGWVPQYFVIDGRLATNETGEWRESEEGHLELFKSVGLRKGLVHVETHWQEPEDIHENDIKCLEEVSPADIALPRITNFKVVGGSLTCKAANKLLVIDSSVKPSGSHIFFDGPHARLPDMYPDYKLFLIPFRNESLPLLVDGLVPPLTPSLTPCLEEPVQPICKGTLPRLCTVPEAIEPVEYPISEPYKTHFKALDNVGKDCGLYSSTNSSPVEETESNKAQSPVSETSYDGGSEKSPVDNHGDNTSSDHSSWDHWLIYTSLVWLLFGLLMYWYVEARIKGKRYALWDVWGLDQVDQAVGWQEIANASVANGHAEDGNIVLEDELNKALTLCQQNNHTEKTKCQAFRDWFDHALGWKEWQGYDRGNVQSEGRMRDGYC